VSLFTTVGVQRFSVANWKQNSAKVKNGNSTIKRVFRYFRRPLCILHMVVLKVFSISSWISSLRQKFRLYLDMVISFSASKAASSSVKLKLDASTSVGLFPVRSGTDFFPALGFLCEGFFCILHKHKTPGGLGGWGGLIDVQTPRKQVTYTLIDNSTLPNEVDPLSPEMYESPGQSNIPLYNSSRWVWGWLKRKEAEKQPSSFTGVGRGGRSRIYCDIINRGCKI